MLFSGLRFVLIGFDSISEEQFSKEIVSCGGVDVGRYDASCTHVIVHGRDLDDPVCIAARSDGKTLITDLWVEDSLDMGRLADANRVLYQPVKDLKGIPGSQSLCMCLTGYQGTKRDNVMKLVNMMGAKFLKPLNAARVTHLICYKFEGEKYDLAKRTNIELVNHQWLEDCLKAWKILPTDKYKRSGLELEIMEAEAKDSEGETGEDVLENISSLKALLTPRNCDTRTPLREITGIEQNAAVTIGFKANIPNNVDILESSSMFTPSKVSHSERNLGLTDPRDRVDGHHHQTQSYAPSRKDYTDVNNDEVHQDVRIPNGHSVDPDKEAYNASTSTRNKKRSPHSEAAEGRFGTKTFYRKALRKSLEGDSTLSCSSPQGNLVDRGKDVVDISNLSLEQTTKDLKSVEANSGPVEASPKKDQGDTSLLKEQDYPSRNEVTPPKSKDDSPTPKPSVTPTSAELGRISMSDKQENGARYYNGSAPMGNGPAIEPIMNQQGDLSKANSRSLKKMPLKRGEQPKNDVKSVEVFNSSFQTEAHPKKDPSDTSLLEKQDCLSRNEVSPPKSKDDSLTPKPSVRPTTAELGQMSISDKLENLAGYYNGSALLGNGPATEPIMNQQRDMSKTKSCSLKKKPLKRGRTILQAKASEAFASLSNDMGTVMPDMPMESDDPAELRSERNHSDAMETDYDTVAESFVTASGISAKSSVEPKLDIKPDNGNDTFNGLSNSSTEVGNVQKLHHEGDLSSLNNNNSKIVNLQSSRIMINRASTCLKKKVLAKKKVSHKKRVSADKTSQNNAELVVNANEDLNGPNNTQDAANLEENITNKGTEPPQVDPEADEKTARESVSKVLAPQTSSGNRAVLADEMESTFDAEKENKPNQDMNQTMKSDYKARATKSSSKSDRESVENNTASVSVTVPEPVWFILSGHHLQRKEFQQVIRRLRGRVCRDSHNWSYQASHFIVPDPVRRTEKFFAAAASGRWILKTDYLTASKEAGKFLDEEPFEWYKKGLNEDGAISLEAPRKWRQLRQRTGHGAFYGMRIVVYGECIAPSLDTLKRVIKAGDGTILATSPPYTRFLKSGVDYAIVSAGMPHVDGWVQEFLKHEIPCVSSDYLVEYVCKPGYSLERHVLYKTNSWAEKSFQNQLKRSEAVVKCSSPAKSEEDDIACEICGSRDRGEVMLICGDERGESGCGIGIHIDCCDPPLEAVPDEDWFCSKCCRGGSKSSGKSKSKSKSSSASLDRVKNGSSSVRRSVRRR
ncbi:hypothetical protein H6P81_004110 [Aristolochia fimbriata]|uniref:BRCT domain-containing protein n=1 Tax=Aristolochia fimbriata TaxID=158543 RepID=A0AAV7FHR3_ARIFI|nr:hypothetical protein H6P81_004110 [Aristolochia fimbriata]